ncbi:MAG TPA: mitochondrial fission ELM1 family protein [Stellaceae bacterium]|nr:mitochondrial fission ELM1 family protein [Stellaceae bacterium]
MTIPLTSVPTVWAVHDGKIGMASQVIGLAQSVGWPFVEKRLDIRAPWRHLVPPLWFQPLSAPGAGGDRLEPPWPDLIIACGRNSVAPALAVKERSGGRTFWVQIQDPRFARRRADLLVVPSHDPVTGANVCTTLGAVHRVTRTRLEEGARRFAPLLSSLPRPLVAVLIGGDNRVYRWPPDRFAAFVDQLAALARAGYGLAITPSRRTSPAYDTMLRDRLKDNGAYVWDGSGENPYFGLLGLADAIVVTGDSVNMISEAAATGKPVHVVALEGGSDKFTRFHRAMAEAGITRPFEGRIDEWRYRPPDDQERAAALIRDRLTRRPQERVA